MIFEVVGPTSSGHHIVQVTASDGRVVEIARFNSAFEAHQELTWAVNRYLELAAESKP